MTTFQTAFDDELFKLGGTARQKYESLGGKDSPHEYVARRAKAHNITDQVHKKIQDGTRWDIGGGNQSVAATIGKARRQNNPRRGNDTNWGLGSGVDAYKHTPQKREKALVGTMQSPRLQKLVERQDNLNLQKHTTPFKAKVTAAIRRRGFDKAR